MEKYVYDNIKETLFYEKLPNGLEVYLLPRKGYKKYYATFTTKYGSIDNTFIPIGKTDYINVPDGIAHFLEHKMFESEKGDAFEQFTKYAANANAFTSFNRTAYLFSCTSYFDENLNWLPFHGQYPSIVTKISKPKNYEIMLGYAKVLASDFSYVRVDFYNIEGVIYFGELTFAHANGSSYFSDKSYDEWMGNLWQGDPRT